MLDIKFIRENTEKVKQSLKNRGMDLDVDYLIATDEKRREKIKEVDDLRAKQNELSDSIARSGGKNQEVEIRESKELKKRLLEIEPELRKFEEEFQILMYHVPNVPLDDVPVGKDENENKSLREVGTKPDFKFTPRDYMVIAEALDLVDTKRAAKVSGSRFGYLKGAVVRLELALVQLALEHLTKQGFVPVIPPVLIKDEMMRGMGYVDSKEDQEERYHLEKDKLYLVGTAEQSVGPMHTGEIFQEKDLPKRYVAFSTCFRREAGSYGKDTHGILRVHQFDKVEMLSFTKPEDSRNEHGLFLQMQEELMQELKIPYRVVALCTGDLAAPSASTFDIESWLPGQNSGKGEYRETHSTSNTTDFQARRLNIRYRSTTYKLQSTNYIHMLNGTVFAIGRTIIAILENYQQEDGSVKVPEALQKYMGGMKVIQ
jgi:seryl-tRNA synthetase